MIRIKIPSIQNLFLIKKVKLLRNIMRYFSSTRDPFKVHFPRSSHFYYSPLSAYLEARMSAVREDPLPTVAYSSSLVSCSSCIRSANSSSRSFSSASGVWLMIEWVWL